MESANYRIFAGSSGKPFAQRMCRYLGVDLGKTEVITFSEGNTFVKIGEHVRGKAVYLVQPIALNANNEFVEILFWMDAFKRSGAGHVTVIIPYFSYAKGDKKDEPRVSIRARVCAECIELAGADRVMSMDLHAAQIQGFFKKPVDHLYARPLLCEYIKQLDIDNLVVVSPDAGFAKNARKYADHLGLPLAIGDKQRVAHDEKAEVLELIGDVNGKNTLMVDDFTVSGGTLIDLARMLKARGARRIFACLSHTLVRGKNLRRLEESDIEMLITTDTVNNPELGSCKKVKIISVAPLFVETVRRVQADIPISGLFDDVPEIVLESALANPHLYALG